ncbi:MAG: efflux RND transporter periplasmic adaptor subunit [Armatimonadetes bacterium]|nr:efflux RND transporter periplasmic adaptor subunit [Armatimonadota bacterium]
MKSLAIILVFSTLGLVTTGCVNREQQAQAARTEKLVKDPTIPVLTRKPESRDLAEVLDITGQIASGDDTQVSAKLGGRLTVVYVRDGDTVRAGQVVAEQETTEGNIRLRQALAGLRGATSQLQQAMNEATVGPRRTSSSVRAAQAQLNQAKASLARTVKGDRPEQRLQIKAQVDAAKVAMENARKTLERYRALFAEGAVSKQEVEQFETAYANALANYQNTLELQRIQQSGARSEDITVAQQQVRAAEEALRNAQAAQQLDPQLQMRVESARSNVASAEEAVSLARQGLTDTSIRSPFSGQISGKPLQAGTVVAPGTPIARVIGQDGIYFEGEVPETKLSKVTIGSPVSIKLDAFPNQKFPGQVKSFNPIGSSVGRVFKVKIQLMTPNPAIKPGMFALGQIETRVIPGALTLPRSAIMADGQESYVMVADGAKAKKVTVKKGIQQSDLIEVIGLDPNADVIVSGQDKVSNGTGIRIDNKK